MAEAENDFGDLGVVICIDLFRFARIIAGPLTCWISQAETTMNISKPRTAINFSSSLIITCRTPECIKWFFEKRINHPVELIPVFC